MIGLLIHAFLISYLVVGGLAVSKSDCEVIVQGSIPSQPMFPLDKELHHQLSRDGVSLKNSVNFLPACWVGWRKQRETTL